MEADAAKEWQEEQEGETVSSIGHNGSYPRHKRLSVQAKM